MFEVKQEQALFRKKYEIGKERRFVSGGTNTFKTHQLNVKIPYQVKITFRQAFITSLLQFYNTRRRPRPLF